MERIYNTISKFNKQRKRFFYGAIGFTFLAFSIGLFLGNNQIPIKIRDSIIDYVSEILITIF